MYCARRVWIATALGLLLLATPSSAADVWSDPFPGIRYLHRSTTQPKEIHALVVDLTHPAIFLRATKSDERGRTVTSFSNLVGAAAAVNGDFYNTDGSYDPVGLAIGEGLQWTDGQDSTSHNFMACTALNDCLLDISSNAVTPDPSWWSAVGGNTGLISSGVKWTSAQDTSCGSFCTTLHPRTAAGLSQDGNTLILVVVEGRQDPILGMSLSSLATLMEELGAYNALNLDGGGSSSMVVDGSRVSGRPANEPSERSVANHLAVIYDATRATSGRLVGYVRENDIYNTTGPIAGALVHLSTGQNATTSDTGLYDFAEVVPGTVTVTASKPGYQDSSLDKVIEAGITNWRSMALVATPLDAGISSDAATAADATSPPVDSGSGAADGATAVDAGTTPRDVGTSASDAGLGRDSASTAVDSGADPDTRQSDATPASDLGSSPVEDSGVLVLDVPPREPDDNVATAGGCYCAGGRGPQPAGMRWLGLVLVALWRRARFRSL
ncbi:MAG: phosphodiester glycosidase family protein [Pseudomonadota bacterium]